MSNFMQDSAAWLGQQLKETAGRVGVYTQGGASSDSITASPAEFRQEVLDSDGLGTGVFVYGWLFVVTDLVINGNQIEPRNGDRFEETLVSVDVAWEAMPPGPQQSCSKWADSSGTLLIVWFKKVKR